MPKVEKEKRVVALENSIRMIKANSWYMRADGVLEIFRYDERMKCRKRSKSI
jgi:hypothetical protein